MDIFKIITPATYWLLILIWSYIFIFYLRKLFIQKTTDKFFRLLLIILAIDAFRTLFESAYFGAWYTSLSEIIPISIYNFLAQPEIVFFPKIFNLIASFLVLSMIIRKWIPEETNRIITFNKLLKERTKVLENESHTLRTETQIARENEAKYKKATVNSPFPIMIHAEDGEVILVNKSWTKLSGYKLEDISTISEWTKKAYGKQSETVKEYIDELYQINEAKEEGEFTIKTKSGEERIWVFSSAPLDVLPDGRRMIISSAMDVSERKNVEKQKQEIFNRLNQIASNIPGAIYEYCLNPDGTSYFPYASEGFFKIYGISPNQVKNDATSVLNLIHPDDLEDFTKSITKSAENLTSWQSENRVVLPSGKIIWIEGKSTPQKLDDGTILWYGYVNNITERKMVQETLNKSQVRYQTLFGNMLEATAYQKVLFKDDKPVDYVFIEVNNSFYRLTGYKDVVGKRVSELVPEIQQTNPDLIERYGRVALTGEAERYETYIAATNSWFFTTLFSIGNNIVISMFDNISEKKLAEKALKESETLLKTTGKVAKVGGWSLDVQTQQLNWTEEVFHLHELPLDFVPTVEQGISFYHPDDQSIIADAVQDAIENSKPFNVELRIVTAKRNVKWVNARGNIIKTETTKIIGTFQDITERKLATIELRKSEERYRDLILNLDAGIVIHAKDTSILFNNHRASELLGLTDNQIQGKQAIDPNWKFIHEDNTPLQLDEYPVMQVVNSKKSIKNIMLGVIKPETNEISWLTVNGFPILKDNSEIEEILISFVEITEQKIATEEIEKLNEKLEQKVNTRTNELLNSQTALLNIVEDLNEKSELLELSSNNLEAKNKELETFTYSVSHDLKAPLRGIDGYSRLLEDTHYDKLDEEGKNFIRTIREGTKQMNQLIEDLLSYSRLERASFRTSSINAIQFIENNLLNYKIDISSKNITIEKDICDCQILADTEGLAIAFRNILGNAIKFSNQVEKPKIEIVLKENVSSWILSIKDNGVGFDMKYQKRIFEIFQRLQRAEDYPGTGIGLALVNKAVQRMNGKIWAESTPNIGSTFFIEIPKS